MKLIVLYGAPGVGKLTTARALAALTGFRLFHNHLTFDLVKALFDFPSPAFGELAERVRLAAFEAAARNRIPGVIFTYVYAAPIDDSCIEKMITVVEGNGGEVLFVRLHCDNATHEARVLAPERRRFGKIVGVEALRGAMARWDFSKLVPSRPTLEIENAALSAAQVARQIAARFSLPAREIRIRPMAPDDIAAVAALVESLAREHMLHEFAPQAQELFLLKNNAASIRDLVQKGFRYHVATASERIIGVVGTRDDSHLYHLFVANEFQRQGLGRRLWDVARAECVAAGHRDAFTVNSSNNAIAVYEKLGFSRAGPAQDMGGVIYNPMSTSNAAEA